MYIFFFTLGEHVGFNGRVLYLWGFSCFSLVKGSIDPLSCTFTEFEVCLITLVNLTTWIVSMTECI